MGFSKQSRNLWTSLDNTNELSIRHKHKATYFFLEMPFDSPRLTDARDFKDIKFDPLVVRGIEDDGYIGR